MKYFAVLAISAFATSAAADVSLSLPLSEISDLTTQSYRCGDEAFDVLYVNAGANNLAMLTIDGEKRIFVNVVSGSGARYASGAHIWWSKGDSATLENQMQEGSLIECQAAD